MKNTFYITTPIYYPSNKFTLGNCYTTVLADVIARFNRLQGKDVFFLTGTDEHGQKISQCASKVGKSEKEYLDEMVADAKALWASLDITYDKFIRTTDDYHEKSVQKIFKTLYDKGYIYKGKYSGWYCTPCEAFWTQSQLVDGKCPDCGREVNLQEEEAYFFKLSQFSDRLLKLYQDNPQFLLPATRVNEMVNNFIKPGLEDLCVSRTSVKWGIPVDFDSKHTVYVWIDALTNYINALGFNSADQSNFEKYWPADLHLIGKEIVRFHAIIWPAILMALDLPLPKQIFAHGWMLFGGDKLSKSKETGKKECIDPRVLQKLYGADAIRYVLCREIPFGSDGNYSTEIFLTRFNSDLSNNYGNLVSRTLSMLKKYFNSTLPKAKAADNELANELKTVTAQEREKVFKYMREYDVTKAVTSIFNIFSQANKYIEQSEPWTLAKDPEKSDLLASVMRNLIEVIRIGSLLLCAFMPNCTSKVLAALGITDAQQAFAHVEEFYALPDGITIEPISILFPRLDIVAETQKLSDLA